MKIRPKAVVEKHYNEDGRREWDEIDYYCPYCNKRLRGYGMETGCPDCEILFDWGSKEPEIIITKTVIWE